jgi:hypothetical protein
MAGWRTEEAMKTDEQIRREIDDQWQFIYAVNGGTGVRVKPEPGGCRCTASGSFGCIKHAPRGDK